MLENTIVVEGIVTPDGTLQLEEKLPLPAGKVQVTLQSLTQSPQQDAFLAMLEGIWQTRAKAGLVPRSSEEVEALRRDLREQSGEEIAEAMRLQDECRRSKQTGDACKPEAG